MARTALMMMRTEAHEQVPSQVGVRAMLGLLLAIVVVSVGFASAPLDNPVEKPHHWWQCLLRCMGIWMVATAACLSMMITSALTGQYHAVSVRAVAVCWMSGCLAMSSMWAGLYCVWVYGCGLPYPMPFHGIVSGQTGTVAMVLTSMYSSAWGLGAGSSSRVCKAWMKVTLLVLVLMFICHLGVCVLMQKAGEDLQWLVALLFPLTRQASLQLSGSAIWRASGKTDKWTKVLTDVYIHVEHYLFLAIVISSSATWETDCILLGMDLLDNAWCAYDVVKRSQNHEMNDDQEVECALSAVRSVVGLYVAVVAPIGYLLCVGVILLGPNAEVMGHIKADMWSFEPVEYLDVLQELSTFVGVELATSSVIMLICWLRYGVSY